VESRLFQKIDFFVRERAKKRHVSTACENSVFCATSAKNSIRLILENKNCTIHVKNLLKIIFLYTKISAIAQLRVKDCEIVSESHLVGWVPL
jgi:hypothetical protein